MKKLLFAFLLSLMFVPAWSQTSGDIFEIERTALKAEKRAIVDENMNLTKDEALVFWPVYDEFDGAIHNLQNERIAIIKDYAGNFDNLDDVKAQKLLTRSLKLRQDFVNLEVKYFKKMMKVVSPTKAARFFQIHNKLNAIINAEIAIEIPLVEAK